MQRTTYSVAMQILLLLGLLAFSDDSHAQPLSVRFSAGVVQLPLPGWSDFFGNQDSSFYQKNNPNIYFAFTLDYSLSKNHSVGVGAELIRSSASLSSLSVVDWKFQGIPLIINYEYRFPAFNGSFVPIAGVGLSYFFSQVEAREHFFNQTMKRTGTGYGVHGSVGLISQLAKTIGIFSQLRYRYANGMAFTDRKGDIKVEFTGFDFSTGLVWTL